MSGCSNAPGTGSDTAVTGTVELPLTAQAAGVKYRLNSARFTIQGSSGFSRVITPAADLPIDQEVLPADSYVITLSDGWVLEAEGPNDTSFSAVDAELVANPLSFTVTQGRIIDVVFEFITQGIPIKLNKGLANVRISVSDCSQFDSYGAAIAGYTVDCLGRIDQNSFIIDDNGYLRRNFTECLQDQTLIPAIDAFLGLQYETRDTINFPTDPLAYARECIAGTWATWREDFDSSGSTECPDWTKSGVINNPTPELYDRIARALPKLPAPDTGFTPQIVDAIKINSIYSLSFADAAGTDQKCGSSGACAALCAGGFPGFVLSTDDGSVTTDPVPWESNTVYPQGQDPYLRTNYYHPMSYYGPLPGDLFGAVQRVGEACSYYDSTSGLHKKTILQQNCAVTPDSGSACVSLCAPAALQ
ncbi:MAG TPA: hypothetical protein VMI54_07030 [Polyangiaceae bacterium]|nr:hypothetical protein [Polyangiaceae bacterium]